VIGSEIPMSNLRLLLAEEDEHIRTFLADNLTADGYDVDVVEDRDEAVARLRTTAPDVIVVDVNGTTLALLDWLRGADSALCAAATDTPVIVLTSRSEEVHWVRLLERGGDDVIVKPFSYPELRARIAAVLRRTMPRQPRTVLTAGPVRVDLRDRRVTVDERPVELSAVEYRLLCHLAAEPSRVFTREELLRDVWGYHSAGRTRTLDSHACRLRAKLSSDTHRLVINVWGVGLRLIDGELHSMQ
jgi:DNA-binding response OmpR family regulator